MNKIIIYSCPTVEDDKLHNVKCNDCPHFVWCCERHDCEPELRLCNNDKCEVCRLRFMCYTSDAIVITTPTIFKHLNHRKFKPLKIYFSPEYVNTEDWTDCFDCTNMPCSDCPIHTICDTWYDDEDEE